MMIQIDSDILHNSRLSYKVEKPVQVIQGVGNNNLTAPDIARIVG